MLKFDPAQLATLAAVARTGSFERAAAVLGLTAPAVSQRIRALEEAAGCLLVRRSQPARPSPAGERLIRYFEAMSLLEAQVLGDLLPDRGAWPRLRIAVNADSLATWAVPALAEVEGFLFDLVIEDQDESLKLLRDGAVAGAISAQSAPVQGCDCVALGVLRYHATMSPAFAARWFAQGVTAEALAAAPMLRYSAKDQLQARWIAGHAGLAPPFPLCPTHEIPSSQGFVDGCLAGLGWGLNPAVHVAAPLADGRLIELVPGAVLDVPLVWHFARLTAAVTAPLTRALRRHASRALLPIAPS